MLIPLDSDSRFGLVVDPRVVDIFVELETSNDYDSDSVVVVRRIALLGLMLTKMCLYAH